MSSFANISSVDFGIVVGFAMGLAATVLLLIALSWAYPPKRDATLAVPVGHAGAAPNPIN